MIYAGDAYAGYTASGEIVSPGAQTHVVSYPVGPLMSAAGRLCATPNTREFWNYSGSVVVRGRLIPSGTIVTSPSTNSL